MERMAPCKVNLALDILGRRPDGYHELQMVMQTVSLCDTVKVRETATGFSFHTDGDFTPADRKTLEQKAAEAFFSYLGMPMPGLCVELEKRTPAYAGLGGGSADVAALLHLLRERYAPELPGPVLERIGLFVGSDMPFCVRGGTALAEGRGECLTDLRPLPLCWLVLCKPDFGVATPTLFARADERVPAHRPDIPGMTAALAAGDLEGVAGRLCNVFEEALPKENWEVFEIRDRLRALGALNAAMSGSGPTVFGLFPTESAAQAAAAVLWQRYAQTYVAQPVGRLW